MPAGTGATGGSSSGAYQPTPTYRPVAPAQPQTQAQPYGGSGGVHTVQRGETLWSIAARYYGDGQRWRDIARANNITNEHRLRIGQQLRLP
jgi:5'-nucleotidase